MTTPYRTPWVPTVRREPWWAAWLARVVGPAPLRYSARLNAFRWYRRWCGGHWERAHSALGNATAWRWMPAHRTPPRWRDSFVDIECEDYERAAGAEETRR